MDPSSRVTPAGALPAIWAPRSGSREHCAGGRESISRSDARSGSHVNDGCARLSRTPVGRGRATRWKRSTRSRRLGVGGWVVGAALENGRRGWRDRGRRLGRCRTTATDGRDGWRLHRGRCRAATDLLLRRRVAAVDAEAGVVAERCAEAVTLRLPVLGPSRRRSSRPARHARRWSGASRRRGGSCRRWPRRSSPNRAGGRWGTLR